METKRSTFATSFYIKRSALRNRDGKATIMVKISVDGDDKSMGTKLFVTPDLWENGKAKVISSMLTISIVPIRFLLLYFPANIPVCIYLYPIWDNKESRINR